MSGWAAVGAAIGNVAGQGLGTLFNYQSSRSLRRHAYQDTMTDMKRAGLNPILAYKTGPSPTTNVGMQSQLGSQMVDAYNQTANSAAQRALQRQQEAQARTQALMNSRNYSILQEVEKQQGYKTANDALDLKVKNAFLDSVLNKAKVAGDDGMKALEPLRQLREVIWGSHNPFSLFK